uniref:Uncharacterized protein n=1 Tax=Hucho hucho TaxID=62062 RepID=A0A4W5NX41_9TELE
CHPTVRLIGPSALHRGQHRVVFSMKLPYLDSSTPALSHSANKAQILSWEVYLFAVKVKAFGKLVIRELEMTELWMQGLTIHDIKML